MNTALDLANNICSDIEDIKGQMCSLVQPYTLYNDKNVSYNLKLYANNYCTCTIVLTNWKKIPDNHYSRNRIFLNYILALYTWFCLLLKGHWSYRHVSHMQIHLTWIMRLYVACIISPVFVIWTLTYFTNMEQYSASKVYRTHYKQYWEHVINAMMCICKCKYAAIWSNWVLCYC